MKIDFGARTTVIIVASAIVLIAPLGIPKYLVSLAFITVFYAVLSSAWNLVGGYAGQLSLGNTVFLGIGAYFPMLFFIWYKTPPLLGMIGGGALSALVAVGFGLLTIRLRGNFFAMATLGLSEVALLLADNLPNITGGPAGIAILPGNPSEPLLEQISNLQFPYPYFGYYYVMLLLLGLSLAGIIFLLRTTHGYYLKAIGNDETLAESLGINTTGEKVLAFVVSAVITSFAGSIYIFYIRFITPDTLFAPTLALQIVLMPVIGGMGTIIGPIIGAGVFIPIQNFAISYLGPSAGSLDLVVYAIILIVVVLFAPSGLVSLGKLAKYFRANITIQNGSGDEKNA
ncbi:MAG: branched-chain amino acid ABC transporter permease [Nitrososphaerales archaeon]